MNPLTGWSIYGRLQILQWDGEYACFTFDAATEEQVTGNRRSVKNDILNTFLAEIAQTEYRLQSSYALAFVRSGDRRPGLFALTDEEIKSLSAILAQMPAEAVQPGGMIPDYYVTLSVCSTVNAELSSEAYFWYYGGEAGMYWLSHASRETKLYRIDYAPLAEFLAGLMQPERIDTYGVTVDLRVTMYSEGLYRYITYTHADISFDLVKIVGWDYEIVPYADDQTAFGIRCKPEWLDDWLFFGYIPSKLAPESTSLYEGKVDGRYLSVDGWRYLFEKPIGGGVFWREWKTLQARKQNEKNLPGNVYPGGLLYLR